MIENFGSYLKHERELRGVPLEEISRITKIHIRFLEALEDNRFDELPGEVFIKGYIRSYANIIGSDVDEMLNSYEESIGNKLIKKGPGPQPKSSPTLPGESFFSNGSVKRPRNLRYPVSSGLFSCRSYCAFSSSREGRCPSGTKMSSHCPHW